MASSLIPQLPENQDNIIILMNIAIYNQKILLKMEKSTLTLENLSKIKAAMDNIEGIDQSDNFKSYYNEILWRLEAKAKDQSRLN